MKILPFLLSVIFYCSPFYILKASIKPIPFHQVEMTSDFWRPRLITQRKVLVPFAFDKTKPGVAHLQAAADYLNGKEV